MRRHPLLRSLATLVLAFALATPLVGPAEAAWVATGGVVQAPVSVEGTPAPRDRLAASLAELGLAAGEAERRVTGLTDAEVRWAVAAIANLPAGGYEGEYRKADGDWVYGCLLVGGVLVSAAFSVFLLLSL